jgi:splicing factor 3A subunit 3
MMATSMLTNHGKPEVDVSELPGGIQDAWAFLSEASQRTITSTSATATISAAIGSNHLLQQQHKQQLADDKDDTHNPSLTIGQGQLGKATTMTALSACVHRASEIAIALEQDRRPKGGKILKAALETAKKKLLLVDPLSAPSSSSSSPQAVAATTNLWLRVLDHRLKEIKLYHARNDHNNTTTSGTSTKRSASRSLADISKRPRLGNPAADGYDLASSVLESLEGIRDGTAFSADEVMGKYLDLQPLYESHVVPIKALFAEAIENNIIKKNGSAGNSSRFAFADFLSILSKGEGGLIEGISESTKLKERKKYVRFLVALEDYLWGFLKRTQPLLPEDDVSRSAVHDFQEEWRQKGGSPGWEAKPAEASMAVDPSSSSTDNAPTSPGGIDLSTFSSAAELENAVTGDTLKAELNRLGMKCGGTISDRAKRLFMTKDIPLDQLPKKLFAKKTPTPDVGTVGNTTQPGSIKNERRVDIARREVIAVALLNQLKPTLEATIRRTERRETQTPKEREKEIDEDLHGSAIEGTKEKDGTGNDGGDSDDSDDEDAPIYNPKGVPLGWDGKPIPYWLFKLHGLNHFYPCEICGNESYRGRRNFETHFAESKHSFGMRSLGIPNTKHFHGVTKIEDALNLWDKLKDQLHQEQFDGSKDEEYEDSHGNVLSRATYEDLARQGLL